MAVGSRSASVIGMLRAARHDYPDYVSLVEDYYERGWTDGLPIVLPTEKVTAENAEAILKENGMGSGSWAAGMPARPRASQKP